MDHYTHMTHCIIDWAKYREMDWFKSETISKLYVHTTIQIVLMEDDYLWWYLVLKLLDERISVISIVLHLLQSSQVSLCFLGKVWRKSLWQYLIKSHPCKINRRWRKDQKLPALGETLIWFSLSIRCIINHANLCKLFSKFSKWMKWHLLLKSFRVEMTV